MCMYSCGERNREIEKDNRDLRFDPRIPSEMVFVPVLSRQYHRIVFWNLQASNSGMQRRRRRGSIEEVLGESHWARTSFGLQGQPTNQQSFPISLFLSPHPKSSNLAYHLKYYLWRISKFSLVDPTIAPMLSRKYLRFFGTSKLPSLGCEGRNIAGPWRSSMGRDQAGQDLSSLTLSL